jgi:FKBP-type peptidyl-prolyl cis-trans isomerase (trigger factor)
MRERTGEAIAALVTDDIPEALVDSELQQRLGDLSMGLQAQGMDLGTWLAMQGRDPQEFLGQLRGSAESSARLDLALRAVVAAEGIEVGDSDLLAEWESVAQRVGVTPEEVAERFESGDQVDDVRMDLAKRKAFDWIVERVEVVDEDGNPVGKPSSGKDGCGGVGEADVVLGALLGENSNKKQVEAAARSLREKSKAEHEKKVIREKGCMCVCVNREDA